MKKYFFIVFLLIFMVSACATIPTKEQFENADCGYYPENYQALIEAYYAERLFDPYSAHYRWLKGPYKGWFSDFGGITYGYIVHVGINAKNRFGAYVGEEKNAVMIRNGVIIGVKPLYLIAN